MKRTTAILVALLVATNGFWMYRIFDQAVTLTYLEVSVEDTAKAFRQAEALANLNVIGRTATEVVSMIETDVRGSEPFRKEGCLYVGSICLRLDDQDVVVAVGKHIE